MDSGKQLLSSCIRSYLVKDDTTGLRNQCPDAGSLQWTKVTVLVPCLDSMLESLEGASKVFPKKNNDLETDETLAH